MSNPYSFFDWYRNVETGEVLGEDFYFAYQEDGSIDPEDWEEVHWTEAEHRLRQGSGGL